MFNKLTTVMTVAALMFGAVAEAKYSSSRSSSSSRSYSSPSRSYKAPSRTSNPSTSKYSSKSKSTKPKATTKSAAKPKPTFKNKAAKQKYESAVKNGTAFKSKSAAQADFKKKHAAEYKSTYPAKPTTRPTHIPQSTNVGGVTHNVTYNQSHGGYGYTNALGAYIMYDLMTDSIHRQSMMNHNGYAVHSSHGAHHGGTTVVHHNSGGGMLIGVIILVFIIGAVVVVVVIND